MVLGTAQFPEVEKIHKSFRNTVTNDISALCDARVTALQRDLERPWGPIKEGVKERPAFKTFLRGTSTGSGEEWSKDLPLKASWSTVSSKVPGTLGTLGTGFEEAVYDLRRRFVDVNNLYDGFGLKKPDNAKIRGE